MSLCTEMWQQEWTHSNESLIHNLSMVFSVQAETSSKGCIQKTKKSVQSLRYRYIYFAVLSYPLHGHNISMKFAFLFSPNRFIVSSTRAPDVRINTIFPYFIVPFYCRTCLQLEVDWFVLGMHEENTLTVNTGSQLAIRFEPPVRRTGSPQSQRTPP